MTREGENFAFTTEIYTFLTKHGNKDQGGGDDGVNSIHSDPVQTVRHSDLLRVLQTIQQLLSCSHVDEWAGNRDASFRMFWFGLNNWLWESVTQTFVHE